MGLGRLELIPEVSVQVLYPVPEPYLQGRKGKKLLDEQEEGGEWVLFHLHSRVPAPLSSPSIEGTDSFLGKKRDHGFRLAVPVLPISRLHIGVLPNNDPEVGARSAWVALESCHGLGIGLSERRSRPKRARRRVVERRFEAPEGEAGKGSPWPRTFPEPPEELDIAEARTGPEDERVPP